MVSEFDLPCTNCGSELSRSTITVGAGDVSVAECPRCGARHYPEASLASLK